MMNNLMPGLTASEEQPRLLFSAAEFEVQPDLAHVIIEFANTDGERLAIILANDEVQKFCSELKLAAHIADPPRSGRMALAPSNLSILLQFDNGRVYDLHKEYAEQFLTELEKHLRALERREALLTKAVVTEQQPKKERQTVRNRPIRKVKKARH